MQPIPDHPTCPPALLGSCSLMEQKTDWLKGSTGEIIRRLKDREDTALTYKRWRTVQMVYVAGAPLMCMYWSCCWDDARSLMEHKVDQMTANLTNRHLEREESAQQIKRYLGWICWCAGFYCMHVSLHCIGCRMMDQKVDQMAAELTRRQLERENSAQQIKRYVRLGIKREAATCAVWYILASSIYKASLPTRTNTYMCNSVVSFGIHIINGDSI